MSFQRPLEDARESNDIVDLIREIASSGSYDSCTGSLCNIRHDLRHRIGHGKEDGVLIHGSDHLRRNDIRCRNSYKDICTAQCIGQCTGRIFEIGNLGHLFLHPVQIRVIFSNDALAVTHGDMPESVGEEQLGNGDTGRTCTVDNDTAVFLLLPGKTQTIDDAGQYDDGGTVLIIMEHRNVQHFF